MRSNLADARNKYQNRAGCNRRSGWSGIPAPGLNATIARGDTRRELDATTAEAWTALAIAATYHDFDWVRADEGFRRALELNPSSAITHEWYGIIYLSPMGRHDEPIAPWRTWRWATWTAHSHG